jgi:hypothetical protein
MYIDVLDRIDLKLTSGLKPLSEQINKLEGKIDSVKDKSSEATASTLRYVISVVVSFVLGSGAIGALQYLESVIRK